MRNETTRELFLRFRDRGDLAALAAVFDRTARDLSRLARALAPEASAADDLLQTTYLKAIESAARFDEAQRLEPWLAGILANEARNVRRRERRGAGVLEEEPAVDADPLGSAAGAEVAHLVDDALTKLPPRYREVLEPHLRGGRSGREIARELGRSPGTVRMQLSRALGRLRAALPPSFATGALVAWLSPRSAALARLRETVLRRGAAQVGGASIGSVPPASTSPWLLGGIAMTSKLVIIPLVLLAAAAAWKLLPEPAEPAVPVSARAAERTPAELVAPPAAAAAAQVTEERAEVAVVEEPPRIDDAYRAALAGVRGRVVEADGTPVARAPIALVELEPMHILSGAPGAGLEALRSPTMLATAGITDDEGRFVLRGTRPHAVHALAVDPRGPRSSLLVLERALSSAEVADLGDLVLAPAAELTGRVVDAAGRPVAGVRVRTMHLPEAMHVAELRPLAELREESALALIDDDEAAVVELHAWMRDAVESLPLPTTRTDESGRFRLRASFAPEAILIADHPGLAPAVAGPFAPPSAVNELVVGDVLLGSGTPLEAQVLDAAGQPVDAAEVLLGRIPPDDGFGVLHPAAALGAGRYGVAGLSDQGSAIAAVRIRAGERWHVTVVEDGGAESVEVRLGAELPVELAVRDEQGRAVRGATFSWMPCSLLSDDREFTWLGRSLPLAAGESSAGRYRTMLPEGEHVLWVTVGTVTSRHELEIEFAGSAADEALPVELTVGTPRTLQVVVIDADTGEPVPRARITVVNDKRWPEVRSGATTDAQGAAALPAFATREQDLLLSVEHPAYATSTQPLAAGDEQRVELSRGGQVVGTLEFTGPRPAQKLVFNLRDVTRGWSSTGRIARFAHVNADGTFRLEHVPPGRYAWEVATNFLADTLPLALSGRMEDYYDMDKGHFEDTWARGEVVVAAGEVARVDPGIEPRAVGSAAIEGRLTVHGEPRAGALIVLKSEEDDRVARTSVRGTFAFREVVPGEVELVVAHLSSALGSIARDRNLRREFEVAPGAVEFVELELTPTEVSIEVLGGGQPLADARISIGSDDGHVTARSDVNGRARLQPLVAGALRWQVVAEGWVPASGELHVESGATDTHVPVELEPAAPFAGQVLWSEFSASPYAILDVRVPGEEDVRERVRVGENGEFTLRWLGPGEYEAVCRTRDAKSTPLRFEIPHGGATGAHLAFQSEAD